jgi:hypothetical protein
MSDQQPTAAVSESQVRVPISKRLRFEVFKRDGFRCQYCGATAPEVVLHVDHITPVAAGGTTDLLNLVTSCAGCNLGKADKRLDDSSVVTKTRVQLEELQARREQLEMLLAWREGLRGLAEDTVQSVRSYWEQLTPGWSVNDNGIAKLRKWIQKFSVEEVLHAMDVAAVQYLQRNSDQRITQDSWEEAWSKIPGICRVDRESQTDPDARELYYIRGILRKRLSYLNERDCMELMRAARSWDVSLQELRSIAVSARSWSRFRDEVCEAIEQQKLNASVN